MSTNGDGRWHYILGDIHGCHEELLELEALLGRHAERNGVEPHIVCVGDLVDRGPDSAAVVAHFRRGREAGTHAVVMGNHEAMMLTTIWEHAPWDEDLFGGLPPFLDPPRLIHRRGQGSFAQRLPWEDYRLFNRFMWIGQGGRETMLSYGCDPDDPADWSIDDEDLAFLLDLPVVWEGHDAVVTHALVDADELRSVLTYEALRRGGAAELEEAEREAWVKAAATAMWRRGAPDAAPDPGRIHVSGHTVLGRVKRFKDGRVMQIDTGCVYGQRLTAWCVEDDRLFNVQKKGSVA